MKKDKEEKENSKVDYHCEMRAIGHATLRMISARFNRDDELCVNWKYCA